MLPCKTRNKPLKVTYLVGNSNRNSIKTQDQVGITENSKYSSTKYPLTSNLNPPRGVGVLETGDGVSVCGVETPVTPWTGRKELFKLLFWVFDVCKFVCKFVCVFDCDCDWICVWVLVRVIAMRITVCSTERCCSESDPTEPLNASGQVLARWVSDAPQCSTAGLGVLLLAVAASSPKHW